MMHVYENYFILEYSCRYGVIVLAKDFPLLHGPPKSASEASGALCVLPEMIQARQGNDGALPKLKVLERQKL